MLPKKDCGVITFYCRYIQEGDEHIVSVRLDAPLDELERLDKDGFQVAIGAPDGRAVQYRPDELVNERRYSFPTEDDAIAQELLLIHQLVMIAHIDREADAGHYTAISFGAGASS